MCMPIQCIYIHVNVYYMKQDAQLLCHVVYLHLYVIYIYSFVYTYSFVFHVGECLFVVKKNYRNVLVVEIKM